ncbi:MAG: NAD-dependent epimerase/dehydratase family protein, partial [Candidatus Nanoarchaeia archaeon]
SFKPTFYLFTTHLQNAKTFLKENKIYGNNWKLEKGYQKFFLYEYNAVINCIGAGTPSKLGQDYYKWFKLIEEYDNMILNYLLKSNHTIYINFSSGAIYNSNGIKPVSKHSICKLYPNYLKPENFYTICRLNSEAKHRALDILKIVDIRIFSFFSRFIDLSSGYLISEILNCIIQNKPFITTKTNIIRDYIHPKDLFALILTQIQAPKNHAIDAKSLKPVKKFEMLDYFEKKYGLKIEIKDNISTVSPNGERKIYYSKILTPKFQPKFKSIETIATESEQILNKISYDCAC